MAGELGEAAHEGASARKVQTTGGYHGDDIGRAHVNGRTTHAGVIIGPAIPGKLLSTPASGRMEWADLDHGFKIEYSVLFDRANPLGS